MGNWAFPMNAGGEKERQTVCVGYVVPSELQFQLYHVHTRLFNPGGFLPIIYKPLFLLE